VAAAAALPAGSGRTTGPCSAVQNAVVDVVVAGVVRWRGQAKGDSLTKELSKVRTFFCAPSPLPACVCIGGMVVCVPCAIELS
jgi:hypothetical protein